MILTPRAARLPRVAPATFVLAGALVGAGCVPGSAGEDRGAEHDAATRSSITWSDAVALTTRSGGGAAPVFAASADGRLALAWVSAPNGGTDGRLYVQPNAASTDATQPTELRDPLGSLSIFGEVPPKIAFGPDGTLYAAYLVTKAVPGERWPQNALRFTASTDGGASWTPPATVTGGSVFGSYDDHALHVDPAGTIYLSWLAVVAHHSSRTFISRSTDRGRTWSKPVVVDPGSSCPCCRTALASGPDGTLYVAWRKRFPLADAGSGGIPEERDIVVARSTDNGATWSPPTRVYADAWRVNYCPDAGPSLEVGGDGTVHIAWWTGREGRAGAQYARSTDGGRTFSPPVELALARFSRAAHAQLALGDGPDPGLVVVAWDDGTRRVPQIVARVSRDGGLTFGPVQTVSAPDRNAGFPVVALRGDTVLVAWQERSLAAAASDSAARATKDKEDPNTYINAVGSMQVVLRRGVLSDDGVDDSAGAFRPLVVGEPMPFYAAATLNGEPVNVGGAGEVILLNVWATWCTSCREEMADLNALQREFGPKGVRVVGVSVDGGNGLKVRRFAERERLAFAVAHDPDQRVQQTYQVLGVPETFVIGKDGRLRWRHVGNLHPVLDSLRAAIAAAVHGP